MPSSPLDTTVPARTGPATLLGFGAVVLWSGLAALVSGLGPLPPFEVMALTFGVGGLAGLAVSAARGRLDRLRLPPSVWMFGTLALFLDFALYFWAIRLAPVAPASLLSYLWPLFTVLFSAFLPGEKLRVRHGIALALGFGGVAVLAAGDPAILAVSRYALAGYLLALSSALVWAAYSVLSRQAKAVPPDATAGFCLGTAGLAAVAHVVSEHTAVPEGAKSVALLIAIGVGPVGLAFMLWDTGVKQGDIRLLGILSYMTPVLSTLLLVALGLAAPTPALGLACVLVAASALCGTAPSPQAGRDRGAGPLARLWARLRG